MLQEERVSCRRDMFEDFHVIGVDGQLRVIDDTFNIIYGEDENQGAKVAALRDARASNKRGGDA